MSTRTRYSAQFKRQIFDAVKEGMTVNKAAEQFNTPKARIYDFIKAIDSSEENKDRARAEHPPMTQEEEQAIAADLASMSFGASETPSLTDKLRRCQAELELVQAEYASLKNRYLDALINLQEK